LPIQKYTPEEVFVSVLNEQCLSVVGSFNSTNEDLNEFIKKDAMEYQNVHLGVTYLLLDKQTNKLLSYVTFAMGSLKIPDKEEFILRGKKLKDYPKDFPNQFPALLIGRLATDRTEEGKGGASLLIDYGVKLALSEREKVGCGYLLAHAYASAKVVEWYKKVGFKTYVDKIEGRDTIPMYFELQ